MAPLTLAAEAAGTFCLALALVLSGIVAERTAQGTLAPALLINAGCYAATVALLAALAPSRRFNPMATLIATAHGALPPSAAGAEVAAQLAGAMVGVMAAHLLGNASLVQIANLVRDSPGVWLGEAGAAVAFALVLAAAGGRAAVLGVATLAIGLLTAGTAYPNPALTIARTLTDSFVAVRFGDALGIIALEVAAALIAASAGRSAPVPRSPE